MKRQKEDFDEDAYAPPLPERIPGIAADPRWCRQVAPRYRQFIAIGWGGDAAALSNPLTIVDLNDIPIVDMNNQYLTTG